MIRSVGVASKTLITANKQLERLLYKSAMHRANSLVFVYGTLKSGEPNCGVMQNRETGQHRIVGAGRTVTKFPMLVASKYNIPFCLEKPGEGHRIHGEIYEVDEDKMKVLDELEDHPKFYKRQIQQVERDSGELMDVWIYLLPSWNPDLIETGSEFIDNYSSLGPHRRPYVQKRLREKHLKDEGKNIIEQITGQTPK